MVHVKTLFLISVLQKLTKSVIKNFIVLAVKDAPSPIRKTKTFTNRKNSEDLSLSNSRDRLCQASILQIKGKYLTNKI